MTGAEMASFLTTKTDNIIDVAYNLFRRKIEQVFPEDEVPEGDIFKMYWSGSVGRYVTIPE